MLKKTMVPPDTELIDILETSELLGSFYFFFVFSFVYHTVSKFDHSRPG